MKTEAALEPSLEIKRSKRLKGAAVLPGDGQAGFQALLLAAMAEGASKLENLPDSPWFKDILEDFARLGYAQQALDGHWLIHGGSAPLPGPEPLRVRHETELLVLTGFLAAHGCGRPLAVDLSVVGGDALELAGRILEVQPLPSPDAQALFSVSGPLSRTPAGWRPAELGLDEHQAKLVLLAYHLAAGRGLDLAFAKGGHDLWETLAVQFGAPLRADRNDFQEGDELARRIARQMRAAGKQEAQTRILLAAGAKLKPQTYAIPGDVTAASAFCLAATLLKGSDVTLEGFPLNPSRAGFLAALRRMGADVEVVSRKDRFGESLGVLRVRSADLMGKRFGAENLAGMRDEIFMLMVAAAFAEGETILRDITYLRGYREDLLKGFAASLKGAGVEIGEIEDGLVIRGRSDYDGHAYDGQGHPSLALAGLVMGMKSHGASTLAGAGCLEFRYPGLAAQMAALAAGEKP